MTTLHRAAALALIAVAFSALVGSAGASSRQVVSGRVVAPTASQKAGPFWVDACGLLDATASWVAGRGNQVFGSSFKVDPGTRGRRFTLTPAFPADLDIAFATSTSAKLYEGRGVAGERGVVPKEATEAIVCLVAGPPTFFTYRAG